MTVRGKDQSNAVDKIFPHLESLKRHTQTHTGEQPSEKRYECHVCNRRYASRSGLRRHRSISHSAERTYKCDGCYKAFGTKSNFRKHRRTCTGYRPLYECDVSSFDATSVCKRQILKDGFQAGSEPAIEDLNEDVKEEPASPVNGESETCYADLNEDVKEEPASPVNGESDTCNADLNEDVKEEPASPVNGESDTCNADLNEDVKEEPASPVNGESENCNADVDVGDDEKSIQNNRRCTAETVAEQKRRDAVEKGYDDLQIIAPSCRGEDSSVSPKLSRAVVLRHTQTHTREKPYECDLSNQKLTQSSNLAKPKRKHNSEKSYGCNVCNKGFGNVKKLKRHKSTHTGERPYICDCCYKAFKQSRNLKNHKRSHTGETPYKCDSCDKAFKQSRYLKRHKSTHTEERRYKCDGCYKTFKKSRNFKRHFKRTHTEDRPLYERDVWRDRSFDATYDIEIIPSEDVQGHANEKSKGTPINMIVINATNCSSLTLKI